MSWLQDPSMKQVSTTKEKPISFDRKLAPLGLNGSGKITL